MHPRHAPPRASRLDPFSDFHPHPTIIDHSTILTSLETERQNQALKKNLARNAGSLLKRMQIEESLEKQQQQPSQLLRLREAMANLHSGGDEGASSAARSPQRGGGGGAGGYASAARNSPSRADFSAYLATSAAAAAAAGDSPGSSVDRDSSFATPPASGAAARQHQSPAARGGASGAMSSNTAQHILKDMQGLRDALARLEQHLISDMKRRVEAHAALQRTVELRVREISENAEKKAADRSVRLHHTLDGLTQRVAKLEGALAVEREKNARLVQELKYHSVRGLQEVRGQLEQERNARSERIASSARELSNEILRIEEHIAVAKRARDALSEECRDAVARASQVRVESEDKLLQSLMSDVRAMKQRLEIETREREQGEEQLAGAMADLAGEMSRSMY